jgi:beta-N-acetylhexosaminidase
MSDDIGMHALSGGFDERAAGVLAAGCDLALHCSGDMVEMVAVASGAGAMSEAASQRLAAAMAGAEGAPQGPGYEELAARRDELLAFA